MSIGEPPSFKPFMFAWWAVLWKRWTGRGFTNEHKTLNKIAWLENEAAEWKQTAKMQYADNERLTATLKAIADYTRTSSCPWCSTACKMASSQEQKAGGE